MDLTIRQAAIEQLDALAPLWIGMQKHHESVEPAARLYALAVERPPAGRDRRPAQGCAGVTPRREAAIRPA